MQTLQPQTTLQGGKYKIIRTLGQGGFGITYLAEQVMLGRKVAIKEFFYKECCDREDGTSHVTLGTQSNRETVQRFMNKFLKEARTISQLDHPNIIKIHDIFEENNTAYYVMEYIEGENLSELVKRQGALPEATAVAYIKKVADALAYIHARSINHLDVKPGNIMLRQHDQQIVLIDFGLSKQYDEVGSQTSSTPVGISLGFAPIEQYRAGGVAQFTPQTDIYSLGATLYWLVIGKTPPPADEVLEGLPPMPSNVSVSVKQAIESAMKVNKKDRPQSVEVFLNLFDKKKSAPQPSPSPKNVGQNDEETRVLQKESQQPAVLNGYHKKKFDDGSVYEGNFMNGKPEGKGTMKYVGGASYSGEWHYGLREGEGTWNYPDGGSYIGSWVRGRRHGRGTLNKKGGMVIIGEWKNDRLVAELGVKEKEAKATLEKPESFIKGLFKGLLIAAAIIVPIMLIPISIAQCQNNRDNASDYVSNEDAVIPDERYVQEEAVYGSNGNVKYYWTGNIKEGQPEGTGVAVYPNGDKYGRKEYSGTMQGGLKHAENASLKYQNGDSYKGSFANDHFQEGTYYVSATGERFVGKFKDDQPYNGSWHNRDYQVIQKVVNGK